MLLLYPSLFFLEAVKLNKLFYTFYRGNTAQCTGQTGSYQSTYKNGYLLVSIVDFSDEFQLDSSFELYTFLAYLRILGWTLGSTLFVTLCTVCTYSEYHF